MNYEKKTVDGYLLTACNLQLAAAQTAVGKKGSHLTLTDLYKGIKNHTHVPGFDLSGFEFSNFLLFIKLSSKETPRLVRGVSLLYFSCAKIIFHFVSKYQDSKSYPDRGVVNHPNVPEELSGSSVVASSAPCGRSN